MMYDPICAATATAGAVCEVWDEVEIFLILENDVLSGISLTSE